MNEAELNAGLAPTSNYRYADKTGDQLFVAGQVPLDRDGGLVGAGDPAGQVRQCLQNLETLMRVHNFDRSDIRRLVIYVVGDRKALLGAWNSVKAWFNDDVPPSTLLGVNLLGHRGQLVEIDSTIVRDQEG